MKQIITSIAVASALALTASGCSLLQSGKEDGVRGSSATLVIYPSTVGADNSSASVTQTLPSAAPADKKQSPEASSRIAGEWTIVQVGSTSIDRDEDMPYINFVPETGQFYANNGCNTLNGSYTVSSDDVLQFYGVLSTMKYCADVKFDTEINMIITDNKPSKFTCTTVGSESFIDILDAQGRSVMKLRRGDLSFLNGHWEVKSISGLEKLEAPADIFFDVAELKLHGNTGCNYFNGDMYLDHRRSNAVDFSNMGITRMACPYTAQETAMLVALEQTASVINGGCDQVMLLDADGKQLMTLHRIPMDKSVDD